MVASTLRPVRLSTGPILALLLVALFAGCGTDSSSVTVPPQQTTPQVFKATPFPSAQAALPVGIPAIQPTLPGSIPAYTLGDAQKYILCHPMPRNILTSQTTLTAGQTCDQQAFTIVLLQFSPSSEVSKLLNGEPTGLPDNTLLCFTELSGEFAFAGLDGALVKYLVGFEVFDAQTGNQLMAGGLAGDIPTPTPLK
jgi:hypothetical protein